MKRLYKIFVLTVIFAFFFSIAYACYSVYATAGGGSVTIRCDSGKLVNCSYTSSGALTCSTFCGMNLSPCQACGCK